MLSLTGRFLQVMIDGCESRKYYDLLNTLLDTLKNEEMIKKVSNAKFDLAFSHMYHGATKWSKKWGNPGIVLKCMGVF